MAVLPGQAVPVASRGIFTVAATAYNGSLAVGTGIKLSAGVSGTVTGCTVADADKVGIVIGTGSRTSGTTTDQFAGNYAVIALGL